LNIFPGRRLACSLLLLPLAACADGGKEDKPASVVKFAADHHLFGYRTLAGFGTLPIRTNVAFPDRGKLVFAADGTYSVERLTGTATNYYSISRPGALTLYVAGGGRDPWTVFQGGYGPLPEWHDPPTPLGPVPAETVTTFTDRVVSDGSPSIGMYFGLRYATPPATIELEGNWHFGSIHTIFGQSLLAPENVGRAAWAENVQVAAGAAGASRGISGTGQQGNGTTLTLTGSVQNVASGTPLVSNGACNLTLTYDGDSRVCRAAANTRVLLAVDEDTGDGEAGLVAAVRRFPATSTETEAKEADLLGKYKVSGYTIFVNPSDPGSDAFTGLVEFSSSGGFRLDAVDHLGRAFSYTGTFVLRTNGAMTLTIAGTNETWHGAVSTNYQTLMLVDDFRETRTPPKPELNFVLGTRETVVPSTVAAR
jgi:hypothetical protein